MYSVVMMMAMTGAPETPACHGILACLFHCPTTCHGCYGSCYGCYGSCYGGCYSSWSYGCSGYGYYGGPMAPVTSGCSGCYGYGYGMPPNYPYLNPAPKVEEIPAPKKDAPKSGTTYIPQRAGQARVIVKLPADAKLYADGTETNLTSAERTFVTPVLAKGKDFQYQMKVQYQRGGQTFTETKRVVVRADTVSRVEFGETRNELVSSKVTVSLPQGAKLFVDGEAKDVPAHGQFQTPELIKGAEYVYMFKAELNADGSKQAQTQRVIFKAGEAVRVDFTDMVNTSRVTLK